MKKTGFFAVLALVMSVNLSALHADNSASDTSNSPYGTLGVWAETSAEIRARFDALKRDIGDRRWFEKVARQDRGEVVMPSIQ